MSVYVISWYDTQHRLDPTLVTYLAIFTHQYNQTLLPLPRQAHLLNCDLSLLAVPADPPPSPPWQAHLLSCDLSLQAALYAVCADALDGGALRLQERLAPFRRAVPARHDWPEELRALVAHVTNQVRGGEGHVTNQVRGGEGHVTNQVRGGEGHLTSQVRGREGHVTNQVRGGEGV